MKTKALISWVVTAQLICTFVFTFAKSRFSHDRAHNYVLAHDIYKRVLIPADPKTKIICNFP